MVAAAGAGPKPIPQRQLNSSNLADAIRLCLTPEAAKSAKGLAERMQTESGVRRAVDSFHANLPLSSMRCEIFPDRAACWKVKRSHPPIRLSKAAAGLLVENSQLEWGDLRRNDTKAIDIELRRWDPVTATTSSFMAMTMDICGSAVDVVKKPIQAFERPSTPQPGSRARSVEAASRASDDTVYGRPAALTLPTPSKSDSRTTTPETSTGSKVGNAVLGSASGFGGLFKHAVKGLYLDLPLAAAEGMRNAPRLYGGDVYDPGVIRDWKSGSIAAGKNFAHGMVQGIGGLVTEPIKEGKKNGAAGAAKGVGVGLLNMGMKTSSGKSGTYGKHLPINWTFGLTVCL